MYQSVRSWRRWLEARAKTTLILYHARLFTAVPCRLSRAFFLPLVHPIWHTWQPYPSSHPSYFSRLPSCPFRFSLEHPGHMLLGYRVANPQQENPATIDPARMAPAFSAIRFSSLEATLKVLAGLVT